MAVQCMFYIQEVAQTASGAGRIKAMASAKGPYQEWSQYTPVGTFEITSLNGAATEWFRERIGKDVSILVDDPETEGGAGEG